MKIRPYRYVDYDNEETEKREKCKNKVTYNDLRTFLKDTNSGITLFNYSFDILDEDVFAGNPIIHLRDEKRIKEIKLGIDFIAGVDTALQARKDAHAGYFGKEILGANEHQTAGLYLNEENFNYVGGFKKDECIAAAKEFLREFCYSQRNINKTINQVKPNSIINNLFKKSHEKKLDELSGYIDSYCTYQCGITPDVICIHVPRKNESKVLTKLSREWKTFVDAKCKAKAEKGAEK